MRTTRLLCSAVLSGLILAHFVSCMVAECADPAQDAQRKQLRSAVHAGNYRDAYEGFRALALDRYDDPLGVAQDLTEGIQCLQQLGRWDEIDDFREAVIAVHRNNWRLLQAAAKSLQDDQHYGFLISGKFHRGPQRGGGGQVVSSAERDRVRALQWIVEALPLVREDAHREATFYLTAAEILLDSPHRESWRLQYLTELASLPDYEEGWGGYYRYGYGGQRRGAPVDAAGHPLFYQMPKTFEAADSDGQRWRWCLSQAAELGPEWADVTQIRWGLFLLDQFGVQTMADYGWFFDRAESDGTRHDESGIFALQTLQEDETIARLATGIRRFKLPDEFNSIKIFQKVAERRDRGEKLSATSNLARIFENRRQYPKAADYWRQCTQLSKEPEYRDALRQIVGNWGSFEPTSTKPAGQATALEYRFRNGRSVELTAREIDIGKLLDQIKDYLRSRPQQLEWQKLDLNSFGYRLVEQKQRQLLGPEVASWTVELAPREKHFDKRVTISLPLTKAGAYWVTARMQDGNTSHVVAWLADTAIVKKPLDGKSFYFVADARDGHPIARSNVEFFGYQQEFRGGNHFELSLKDFAAYSDADGQVILDPQQLPQNYQWIVTARGPEKRFAFLGFTNVWYGNYYDAQYNAVKVYTITDRPVYRPGQQVHYKLWVRRAQYDREGSEFARQAFHVEIRNPKGDKIVDQPVTADDFGGLEGHWDLPADATLGTYRVDIARITHVGGGTFRVEEYKKPEFDVTVDAPAEPVMLGEKIKATIHAKYYFGSPVTKAKVKYKVNRSSHAENWYPATPWDWLYGPGYWWFCYDYPWYPGWSVWGHARPLGIGWPRFGSQPPELVADREVEIGPDGSVAIEIDTAVAKVIHPDEDHEYTITAEVVDQSRRTITGSGTVLAARKPFNVTLWLDRGYCHVGDVIQCHAAAHTLDGRPVQGKGTLRLLQIRYQSGRPVETPLQVWDVDTDAQGSVTQQLRASQAGQYRLAYRLVDAKGHAIEGGYLFTVIGSGFDGSQFRFSTLELVPDRREYRPGDMVRLMLNTDRPGATVLLFLRPANGVYLPPKLLHVQGKSRLVELFVLPKDMPNFFVEALTVADAQVYTEVKQIVVPPEHRVLNVEVIPSAATYRPGEKASAKLRLTDFFGKPLVGSTVVAIYDKSLEYISGGSNVPDIKSFFWKWMRQHYPQTETSLQRDSGNIAEPSDQAMRDLGLFGGTAIDDVSVERDSGRMMKANSGGAMGGMLGAFGSQRMSVMAGAPVAMPMSAAAPREEYAAEKDAAKMPVAAMDRAAPAASPAALVQPALRSKFADTALWVGTLSTAADGAASVALDMPENLTTWRIKVWGMGSGTRVGEGFADVVTRKDLILRMQLPRFFVESDEVVLSANVHNYLPREKSVRVAIEFDGHQLQAPAEAVRTVKIGPGGEARVDWRVHVLDEGDAVIRMKALTDEESDAMEMHVPCYIHGMLKSEAYSGAIRPEQSSGSFPISVPAQRRAEQSRLEVRYSPTLAGAMVDALPYLVNYPYGCTEQTLNRFLPTVIAQKILLAKGLSLEEIRKKRSNLNAQEIGDDRQRAEQWRRYDRNPVFDEAEVARMVRAGVERLTEMQLSDGGWGWFSGWGEHSDAHTTATVVHGLQIAAQNDVALVPGLLDRGIAWLTRYQAGQIQELHNAMRDPKAEPWKQHADSLDALVYMVLADAGVNDAEMLGFLDRDRTQLTVYGLALFGLALERQGQQDRLAAVLRNLEQYLVQDNENQTAWLRLPESNSWWFWYGSEIETQACYLKLLAKTDPKGEVASRLVKYLLNNRKNASYWNSTRDTAWCIEAMADYLRRSGEDRPEMTVEVWLDGKLQKAVEITPATLFDFDNRFVLSGPQVTTGPHQVELKRKGRGPLYYNGYLTNFTLEDPLTKAGLEIKVERKYYRLVKADTMVKAAGARGQAVDQKVEKFQRQELANLALLKSGEMAEIELTIQSKNDYEYLVFEDMKPAGFEPVDLQSGYNGNALGAYVEFRDNRVVFFVRQLARGTHSVSYRMRAEIPGRFSALPARGSAMYAPELKANSDEIKLRVEDSQ
jgi:hypothetical protein